MLPLPGHLPTKIKGFYDLHNKAFSPPTCVLPPQRVGLQEYLYHITLDPSASAMPRQCIPLCPDGSSEEQSGSIARSSCIKHRPSTSLAPTTTAWAPNRAFGLPLCTQQRCCNQLHTVQLSAAAHQCNAGWCASHTHQAPCRRVDKSTGTSQDAKLLLKKLIVATIPICVLRNN